MMGQRVQVGIPWRPQPSRMEAFEQTCRWYREAGIDVIAGERQQPTDSAQPINLAATRNWLVSSMTSEVMILSDADTLPEFNALREAVHFAAIDSLVHLPYTLYRDTNWVYTPGATSGIYVFNRSAWASTNGQDEKFVGWGYEDAAWRLAHLTLNGPIQRHRGTAVASVHALAGREHVSRNRQRHQLYLQAYGKPDLMRALVNGGGPSVPRSAAEVQNERATAARARIDRSRSARMSGGTRPLGHS